MMMVLRRSDDRMLLCFTVWATLAALTLGVVTRTANAITINLIYEDILSDPPAYDPDASQLERLMDESASIWEDAIEDDWTIEVRYQWKDLSDESGTLGLAFVLASTAGKPTTTRIQFDTLIDGQDRNWFLDPTPGEHSEFDMSQRLVQDVTNGQIPSWYDGLPPDLLEISFSGGDADGAPVEARTGFDLYSVVLHEMGHTTGMVPLIAGSETSDGDYDVDPAHVGGAEFAIRVFDSEDAAHLAARNTVMFPAFSTGKRRLPSQTDVLAVASAANWSVVELPRPVILGDMDCDGDLDFDDVELFTLGLVDPQAYEDLLGLPATLKGDTDRDGDLDFDDIPSFVADLEAGAATAGRLAVAEPTTLSLALAGLFLLVCIDSWRSADHGFHSAHRPKP